PLEVELWHGPTSDTLALRWFHPLTDALGAARLLLWLGEEAPSAGDRPSFAAPDERLPAGFRERLELARRYGQHALSLAQGGPILSPARWVKDAPPGRPRVHRIRFTEEETRRFDLARRRRAGLAEASIIVLAAARLCHRLLREGGGDAPAQHLAVMPVSLDPKGQRDRLFGNNITTLLLALPSASLDDEAAVLARLAAQRRAIVRDGLELGMVASLAAFRALPDGFVHWLAGSPFAGQRGSFIASSPGPLPLERLFGQRVVDAYTSVVPSPQPGLVIVTERQGGRLSLQLCHLDGQIPAASLAAQSGALRADLLGEMR
ncbi:MAG: hypothetical protein KC731_17355, partial [Myxococcales bacterium]|nr:hypothetical protein [Myxococcales bacterium]